MLRMLSSSNRAIVSLFNFNFEFFAMIKICYRFLVYLSLQLNYLGHPTEFLWVSHKSVLQTCLELQATMVSHCAIVLQKKDRQYLVAVSLLQ